MCLWPALLPFNVDRFWWNLVTRTLLWSSLAATIMVQIGRRGTVWRLFENFKKFFLKSQNSNCRILVHHFWRLCLLCIIKKFHSIRTKLMEEIDFEVCPYGNSGNGTAAAAWCSAGYSDWTGGAAACSYRSLGRSNWGRNRAIKTNRLVTVSVELCHRYVLLFTVLL